MISGAMAPCPPDSDLMRAWEQYKASEDYANSFKWATAAIQYADLPKPEDPTANAWTHDHYRDFVQGSMWAAFMSGFAAAGGKTAF